MEKQPCGTLFLVSSHFILSHRAGFYEPTVPQYPPSHLQDYNTCNSAMLSFSNIF